MNGEITVYDTNDHNIGGFSQQQSGDQSLTFTSQHGLVRLADLDIVTAAGSPETPQDTQGAMPNLMEAAPIPSVTPPSTNLVSEPTAFHQDDIISKIERLAGLLSKGIISDEEFAAKKTELLERL